MEAENVMKPYARNKPQTVFDVIKQRDLARRALQETRRDNDQLRMLCQIAAHYIRYLPTRPESADHEIIMRLEAAAKGDMDVARQGRSNGAGASAPSPSPSPADAQPPSVQGDLQPAPAPDPGARGRTPKGVTLTAAEKKVLKALGDEIGTYDVLAPATGLPRHKVISAMHTLYRFKLVERAEGGWRRA